MNRGHRYVTGTFDLDSSRDLLDTLEPLVLIRLRRTFPSSFGQPLQPLWISLTTAKLEQPRGAKDPVRADKLLCHVPIHPPNLRQLVPGLRYQPFADQRVCTK